jgi:uncharacterized protein YegP (UPF0339 family)
MADLKPIRSSRDYEEALVEMKLLWGKPNGSPEGDRLEILATLVDAYEAEHFPISEPSREAATQFRNEQRPPTPSGSSSRFQIYRDKNGDYRFRFLVNSEVMFTSGAYSNKSLLLSVIQMLRADAASSAVLDEAA